MFAFPVNELPIIKKEYSIIRHSVWQAIDPHHIIIFIRDGNCIFEINNKKYFAESGDCFFIPKNTIYTRYPYEKSLCTMFGVHFSMNGFEASEINIKDEMTALQNNSMQDRFAFDNNSLEFNHFYLHTQTHLKAEKELVENLLSTELHIKPKLNFYTSAPSSAFLIQLMSIISSEAISLMMNKNELEDIAFIPEALRKAIFYIQQNYFQQILLDDLSKFCFVSKIQLNRLFNTYFNVTPINYIINYKINKAKDLLQNCPEMSVKEISSSIGYEDQCYFSRLFTKSTGLSPSQFRAKTILFDEKKHILEHSN